MFLSHYVGIKANSNFFIFLHTLSLLEVEKLKRTEGVYHFPNTKSSFFFRKIQTYTDERSTSLLRHLSWLSVDNVLITEL
jgi:hypothetical protein